MIIFPAIDIKDNKCVRLTQGDFDKVNVYYDNPLEVAHKWKNEGAEYIHIVDLNGARSEFGVNTKTIENIANNIKIPIQVGGGVRDKDKVQSLIKAGVTRVILGSIAIENMELVEELVNEYQEKIVVSIDAKDGKVAVRGWEVVSNVDSLALCKQLEKIGVKTIVYTDISKDGMLQGPNFDIYEKISKETSLNVIASGGVTSIEDIKKLKDMNLYGAIIGKALYDKKIDFKEAQQLCLLEE
ncbi:1-(5-phosphoribosyl)-5-[(5-phosphoribosylamino)methylideneamino]imidazole-4-carboxamide isomerase [Clostridioides sp. ES-S-0001-03]|uniref:1-(5-phosphoribosyl)-5-[(5- phosphoribosylamino)methylideneamino]imidazole-4- carboxamide isomerase n=1 Tax=Clostridioides sp. ES-S-0001-03 TaxID=2770771 RepID=UPI001D0CBCB0|nr:1-(5-phosphoribosyl)-5-[(5-phosphoribosylamino)methylideneamino]imidazole-4-carboxamide isomerase [Clostridioides sp. ES-S-0001-03]